MKNILIITILVMSFSASARTYSYKDAPEVLAQELERELTAAKEAFSNVKGPTKPVSVESWVLARFRILIKPYLVFDVLSLFEFKIAPTLELRWERKAPKGWDFYKGPLTDDDDQ